MQTSSLSPFTMLFMLSLLAKILKTATDPLIRTTVVYEPQRFAHCTRENPVSCTGPLQTVEKGCRSRLQLHARRVFRLARIALDRRTIVPAGRRWPAAAEHEEAAR